LVWSPLAVSMLLSIAAEASEAWLAAERAYIRQSPSATSPVIGLLERGDRVQVAEESRAPEGWNLLHPFGAVRSRYLAAASPEGIGEPFDYLYRRVIARSAQVRSSASSEARVVGHHSRGHVLAFKPPTAGPSEWLERRAWRHPPGGRRETDREEGGERPPRAPG